MSILEAVKTLNDLCKQVDSICDVAKTANRNNKSLEGFGFYADKFHNVTVVIGKLESKVMPVLDGAALDPAMLTELTSIVSSVRRPTTSFLDRVRDCRSLHSLCKTKIIPALESSTTIQIPATEQVLPMDVVRGTRGYLEHIVQQANGCYERRWFDSCAVMMRKLIEILIIHVFEAHGLADHIKGRDENFLMLSELVDRFLTEKSWNPGRETKGCLPEVKRLGDRSAHNRTFMARKQHAWCT